MQLEDEIATAVDPTPAQTPAPAPKARAPKANPKADKPIKKDKPDKQPKRRAEPGAHTLQAVAQGYLDSLESSGKSGGTVASYTMELKTALAELGAETMLHELTSEKVDAYFKSRKVTRLKSGKSKAKPSIDKTRRVLRLALVWAAQAGWIEKAPLPEAQEVPA